MGNRFKKMVSLDQVTDRMYRESDDGNFKQAMLTALPAQLFGPTVASRIKAVRLQGHTLVLTVKDPTWKRELDKCRASLTAKVRDAHPSICKVEITELE